MKQEKVIHNIISMLKISIVKTLIFNLKYFGIRGLKMPAFVSRNFKLKKLKGRIELLEFRTGAIKLGFQEVSIFDRKYERGIWSVQGNVIVGELRLGQGVRFVVEKGADIESTGRLVVTANSSIQCCNHMKFGDFVLISWDCLIMDSDHHRIVDSEGKALNDNKNSIVIGDHVWIGCRVTILKNAFIPNGSVVAAGSLVSKNYSDYQNILLGDVNRVLRKKIFWED